MSVKGHQPRLMVGSPAVYRISVAGRLDPALSDCFADMRIESGEGETGDAEGVTTLIGRLVDQSQLAGVLNTLFERRLPILSVESLLDRSPPASESRSRRTES